MESLQQQDALTWTIPPPALSSQQQASRWRELILVLAVAFLYPIMAGTFVFLHGSWLSSPALKQFGLLHGIAQEILAILVLAYVLSRQGRDLRALGFSWQWNDLLTSGGLAIVAYAAYYVVSVLLYASSTAFMGHPPWIPSQKEQSSLIFGQAISVLAVIYVLINPFFEELIVRAFAMSELKALTNRTWIAVCGSVGLQLSYHIYHGIFVMLSMTGLFLVFAMYYANRHRIMPVILAHLYLDVLALSWAIRHSS